MKFNAGDFPLTLRVEDLQKILRLSRASAYELTKQKGFPSIRVGRRILIPRDAFFKWYGIDIYPLAEKVNEMGEGIE
ncbi:helix-turn-helix domain-containing protein [Priestia megaterium]|uniref:Helix-turn-helix domain-containing protein n=1 Tax=Priestia megaterium TaxID=1404 RepID=A0A6H1P279_PRIMG|nr:helix-turn-helix domain-containing protein [Priestia megaterium]QIZ07628.1 helix-turn-helix domain-containing protein [Priestia megaterium]